MKPRFSSLDGSVLTFAHRGGAAHATENTVEAFGLAVAMGATGVESDAWATADGKAVLDHDGVIGPRLRRRRIATITRADLDEAIPSIDALYGAIAPATSVSIDVKDPAAFEPVVAAARAAGPDAEQRLWLCHPDVGTLISWRRATEAKLVLSTNLRALDGGVERTAAELRERGVDALNLPHREWHGGLVALLHRFERATLGWGLEHEREMARLIDIGIDGIYSDHVDRMTAVAAQFG